MDPTDDTVTDIVLPDKDIDDTEDNMSIKSEDDDDDLGRYYILSDNSTIYF